MISNKILNLDNYILNYKKLINIFLITVITSSLIARVIIFNDSNMNCIDELQYLFGILFSRLESFYPTPIFFFIMKFAYYTDDLIFYGKILNLIIYLLGFIPIYYFLQKYTDQYTDKVIATFFFFFSTFSWYTNNIMPDIIYGILIFYLFFFLDLIKYKLNILSIIFVSIFFSIMFFIKNHIIFLIPFIFFIFLKNNFFPRKLHKFILHFSFFLILFYIIKTALNLFFYNQSNLFNVGYDSVASLFIIENIFKLSVIKNILINLFGHSLIFFNFLILLIFILKKKLFTSKDNYFLYVFILYFIMIFSSSFYIGTRGTYFVDDSYLRIHSRYYSYIYPLLFISLLSLYKNIEFDLSFKYFGIGIIIFLFLSKFIFSKYFLIDYIDNPEMNVIFKSDNYIFIFLILFFFLKSPILFLRFFFIFIILGSIIFGPKNYITRNIDTIWEKSGKDICNKNLNISHIYTDSIVGFGFLFYKCPKKYYHKIISKEEEKKILSQDYEFIKKKISIEHYYDQSSLSIVDKKLISNNLNSTNVAFVGHFVYDLKILMTNKSQMIKINDNFYLYKLK